MTEFRKRFRELRESKGLSQEQLADILDIPRTSIAHYETSAVPRLPRGQRLEQIADYFDVSVDFLLGRTDVNNRLNKSEQELIEDIKNNLSLEDVLKKYPLMYRGKQLTFEEKISILGFVKALQDIRDQNS